MLTQHAICTTLTTTTSNYTTYTHVPPCTRSKHSPIRQNRDSCAASSAAFLATRLKSQIPPVISDTTAPPRSLNQTRRYPDASKRSKAHEKELDQLYDRHTIKWTLIQQLPHHTELIPMTMNCRYKTTNDVSTFKSKGRCSVRGDLLQVDVHYDPNKTATFMADKATIRASLHFCCS